VLKVEINVVVLLLLLVLLSWCRSMENLDLDCLISILFGCSRIIVNGDDIWKGLSAFIMCCLSENVND
jgi:hypothetical protein